MIASEQNFWSLIHQYDTAVFPVQYLFSLIAVILVIGMFKSPGEKLNRLINLFLAMSYLWIGIVFFLVHNRTLSEQMHYFQPALMFLIAFLFFVDIFRKKNRFRFSQSSWRNAFALVLIVYSIFGYPLVGWLLEHPYAVKISDTLALWVPILGVYPCPTTIFALSLLSLAYPHNDKKVIFPLLFWALSSVFGPPLRVYGVYEDIGLFLTGLFLLIIVIKNHKRER